MKKIKTLGLLIISLTSIAGCSSGDVRAWNDAMAQTNGYTVHYPDQSDTTYVGDIKWTSGVYAGEGFMRIKNTSNDYCKVRIQLEDDSYKYYYLEPYEYIGDIYMSIYNQGAYMNTLCNSTRSVFNESF